MNKPSFYITTAIAYASAKPHIGNTYEAIMSDAVARYKRARGYDVFFCTGTDEHGQKIQNYAKMQDVDPQLYVDGVSDIIKDLWKKMNVSYDYFIRTTDKKHEETVQKIFERFLRQGDIYKGFYEGWYCTPCEAFFTDTQATDGKCPDCGAPLKKAREEAYFFNMQKYAPKLIDYINTHPDFIEPEARKNEMLNNFLIPGLQDLCVSRTSFTWGIKVPSDPKHVIYVWLDALTNYITALGYDPEKEYEDQSDFFKKNWPADIHMIGKDILRFHTIYWPIFLMALDLPLPKKVFGHPWFNFGTEKMSKSKGNVIYADKMAEYVTVDGVRYYVLAEMPYASDGSATWENIFKRYNMDLVNNLGNLVKRTLDMQKKYFSKEIQPPVDHEEIDKELQEACIRARDEMIIAMDNYHIADAIAAVFRLLDRANKYIDETSPWILAKDESKHNRLGTVLYELLSTIRWAAILLSPFIPSTSEEIMRQLNCETEIKDGILFDATVSDDCYELLKPGSKVGDSTVLFARIDEKKLMEQIIAEREKINKKNTIIESSTEEKETIQGVVSYDDFLQVEILTAGIVSADPVPKSKKLLRIVVDFGKETKQIVSGIAEFYKPDHLIGKKVMVVANLAPVTLCGVESQGMLLAYNDERINVIFLPDQTPLGKRIR